MFFFGKMTERIYDTLQSSDQNPELQDQVIYEASVEDQAVGFIKEAFLGHPEKHDMHLKIADEEAQEKLSGAESVEALKRAVREIYNDPIHMLQEAQTYFEGNYPFNGRSGEDVSIMFCDSSDQFSGINIVNIRTRVRQLFDSMREEFAEKTHQPVLTAEPLS